MNNELNELEGLLRNVPCTDSLALAVSDVSRKALLLKELEEELQSGGEVFSNERLAASGIFSLFRSDHLKTVAISRWPQVLCLHLGRLYFDRNRSQIRKDCVHVEFPRTLSASDLTRLLPFMNVSFLGYCLKAVLVHHGGATSGAISNRFIT